MKEYCFYTSTLETVIVHNPNPICLTALYDYYGPFGDTDDTEAITLVVPKGSKEAYENADVWNWFTNIVEAEE